jgi:transcriptional antiterminator RfaH
MPILQCEPDLYPDDLFERAEEAAGPDQAWWALYTMPRSEKELIRQLRGWQIGCYCPLVPQRRRSPAGRVRTSYLPLFTGYVFLFGGEEQRVRALTTNCVSRCLSVPDERELYRDLSQTWRLIRSGVPVTPEASLVAGQRVTVRSGPLSGLEGVIVRRQGQSRLIVAVDFLQQGASVLVEDWEVAAA